MSAHELCYRMGPIHMPHLIDAKLAESLAPYFYCTCGQWRNIRKPDTIITAARLRNMKQRFDRHVKGCET